MPRLNCANYHKRGWLGVSILLAVEISARGGKEWGNPNGEQTQGSGMGHEEEHARRRVAPEGTLKPTPTPTHRGKGMSYHAMA